MGSWHSYWLAMHTHTHTACIICNWHLRQAGQLGKFNILLSQNTNDRQKRTGPWAMKNSSLLTLETRREHAGITLCTTYGYRCRASTRCTLYFYNHIVFSGQLLSFVNIVTHLGHLFNFNLSDTPDINHNLRNMAGRLTMFL